MLALFGDFLFERIFHVIDQEEHYSLLSLFYVRTVNGAHDLQI